MNRSEKNDWIQKALSGRLSAAEQARFEEILGDDAGFRAEYDEERALEGVLELLPPAPVSSNFTARVLQEAMRETPKGSRPHGWFRWNWRPAIVGSALILTVGLLFSQHQQEAEREQLAQSLTQFSEVTSTLAAAAAPAEEAVEESIRPVSMLQDFQAIQHLAHMPAEQEQDLELYLALHK